MYRSSQVSRTPSSRTSRSSEARPKPRTEYRQTRSTKPFMATRSSSKSISSRPSPSHHAVPKSRVDRFLDRLDKKLDKKLDKEAKKLMDLNKALLNDLDKELDPYRTTKHSTTRTRDLRGAKEPQARRIRNIEKQMEGLSKSSSEYKSLKPPKRALTAELGQLQFKSMDPRLPRAATYIDDNVMPNLRKNQKELEDFFK